MHPRIVRDERQISFLNVLVGQGGLDRGAWTLGRMEDGKIDCRAWERINTGAAVGPLPVLDSSHMQPLSLLRRAAVRGT